MVDDNYIKEILTKIKTDHINDIRLPVKNNNRDFYSITEGDLGNIIDNLYSDVVFDGLFSHFYKMHDDLKKILNKYYEGDVVEAFKLFSELLDENIFNMEIGRASCRERV